MNSEKSADTSKVCQFSSIEADKKSLSASTFSKIIGGFVGVLSLIFFLTACDSNPDFSNPQTVIEATESLWRKNDFKTYFEYLSESSINTYKSLDEFLLVRTIPDSVFDSMETLSLDIDEIELADNYNQRLFKVTTVMSINGKIDTTTYTRTLILENEKWKLAWSGVPRELGAKLYQKGDFKGARDAYSSALEIDPFSVSTRTQMVWCYVSDENRPDYWVDTCAYHLNYLLNMDSESSEIYNTIGAFYSQANDHPKAVDNFLLAADYAADPKAISAFYSNAAKSAWNFDVSAAEFYSRKSLGLDAESPSLEQEIIEDDDDYKTAITFAQYDSHFYIENNKVYYYLKGELTNTTERAITHINFIHRSENSEVYYGHPRVDVTFVKGGEDFWLEPGREVCVNENNSFFMGQACLSDDVSEDNPWKPGQVKNIIIIFGPTWSSFNSSIRPVHLSYDPLYVRLLIPFTVRDPVGWKETDVIGPYSIMEPWNSFKAKQ